MKSGLPLLLAALSCAVASAQTELPDSIAAQELGEIVIEAPKVIHRADMDVYHPSQSATDNAKNGVQLLANLMIPSLSVSDALGTITSAGAAVQVRINGRVATVEQVRNLLPETIKRVEWIENPGLRYNGATTVLNFIVTNPTVGGAVMGNVMEAVNDAFGNYNASVKLNSGRSQIEVGAYYKLTQNLNVYRTFEETFRKPDGETFTRRETPQGGHLDNSYGHFWASYNYIKPDTTILVVEARGMHEPSSKNVYHGLVTASTSPDDFLLTESDGSKGTRPTLSAYLEQHLTANQILVVDFKGQYYDGRTYSDYVEQRPGAFDLLTDVHTDIRDRNQLYAIEADYIKNWSKSRLTAGASYTANRNRSTYENLGGEVFHQRQDKVYFFAEYFQRLNRFTFTAGLGAQYTDFLFRETDLGNSSWNIRPQAALSYRLNDAHQFRLNFESWQSTPSLAETNPTPQQIDGFQWRVGNANIKTATSYMFTLRYNFRLPRVYAQLGVRAFSSPDAITPLLFWEGDNLVTTYENSRGLQNLSFFLSPQIEVIPGWLDLSGYLQWRAERMRGTGYNLTSNAWSGYGVVQLRHWGFTLAAQYIRSQRDLWGEQISWGENLSLVDLTYNVKHWNFSLGCIMPFGEYEKGSKSLSQYNRNIKHVRSDMRLFYLAVNFNFQWGRQKNKANKLINVGGDADSSKAGGR